MKIHSKVISRNVYEATDWENTLIYAPFKNLIARKWSVFAEVQRELIKLIPDKFSVPQNATTPTVLELDMSHACNLNCVYCSINSNDSTNGDKDLKMDFASAKIAIDRVIEASRKANDPFAVVFIGKGEPTLNWAVLTQCVEYINAQKNALDAKGKTIVVTNGVVSVAKATWLAKNINHIALSWDGVGDIQNVQRPLFRINKEGGSYELVQRTASIFRDEGAYFEIRTTWTNLNVDKMVEFTKEFVKYNPFGLNYQPLLLTGKGLTLEDLKSTKDSFVKNFMESKRVAEESNILVMMPSVDVTRINRKFCHAYEGTGFHLSANGAVTACECVFSEKDGIPGEILAYGRLNEGTIDIDPQKMERLKSITADATAGCRDCFARWHCAGGCLNTHLQTSDDPLAERTNMECALTKSIVWETLKEEIKC